MFEGLVIGSWEAGIAVRADGRAGLILHPRFTQSLISCLYGTFFIVHCFVSRL
jgi:hypothetical protein